MSALRLHITEKCSTITDHSEKANIRKTTMTAYDSDNIFTKIIAGDIPCHKIFEDDETVANNKNFDFSKIVANKETVA